MSEFKVGDLVEAVRGERVIRDRIVDGGKGFWGGHLYLGTPTVLGMSALPWFEQNGYTLRVVESAPMPLPTEPGTVIAIGEWWLVRLRPYETTTHSAWELLPMSTKFATDNAQRNGVKTQCVYGDDWVRAEVEQEGGFTVISEPVSS